MNTLMILHILRSWTRPHWQWTPPPPHTSHWLGLPALCSVLKVVFHSLASLFVCILYVFHWYFVPGVCVSLAHICALYPPVRKLHAEGNIFHWSSQICSRIRRLFVWLVRCHHALKILFAPFIKIFGSKRYIFVPVFSTRKRRLISSLILLYLHASSPLAWMRGRRSCPHLSQLAVWGYQRFYTIPLKDGF